MKTIDNLKHITKEEFNSDYYNKKPFLLKGGIRETSYYKKWTLDFLSDILGSKTVVVSSNMSGVYDYSDKGNVTKKQMSFADAVDKVMDSKFGRSFYLTQTSLTENFPELMPDVQVSHLNTDEDHLNAPKLWIGGAGCVFQLHYDHSHNFFSQLTGRKRITFFSPDDKKYLYPNETFQDTHISKIDYDNLDTKSYPLASKATPYDCLVEPGDLLYIAPGWWHLVRSLDLSISLNYWWERFDLIEGVNLEALSTEHLCQYIQVFLEKGLSIQHKDHTGEYLIVKAVHKGYLNVARAFLLLGTDPNSISQVISPGSSLMEIATKNRNLPMASLLEEFGAPVPSNV
ncbi:cupin-like domain-containing protein [Fulvivirga sp.]|uniref:cupin-like domain-containing protein n=1 Tax=Fulvivirga sp. TaxID=1931237 RepID=UPI0032EE67F5